MKNLNVSEQGTWETQLVCWAKTRSCVTRDGHLVIFGKLLPQNNMHVIKNSEEDECQYELHDDYHTYLLMVSIIG